MGLGWSAGKEGWRGRTLRYHTSCHPHKLNCYTILTIHLLSNKIFKIPTTTRNIIHGRRGLSNRCWPWDWGGAQEKRDGGAQVVLPHLLSPSQVELLCYSSHWHVVKWNYQNSRHYQKSNQLTMCGRRGLHKLSNRRWPWDWGGAQEKRDGRCASCAATPLVSLTSWATTLF